MPPPVARALAAASVPQDRVALWVQPLAAREPTLAYNAAAPMNPASTIKLLTTWAALELLGPAHQWSTEVWSAAPLEGERLRGALYLRGGGDPKLTFENFWLLLRALRARGVREIQGNLVLDRSWLETPPRDPGRFDGRPLQPYNAGPDALLLNFNAFRFGFVPDPERQAVRILAEPPSVLLEIANGVSLSGGPCGDWRAAVKASFHNEGRGARASFAGAYAAACGEQVWNVSLLASPEFVFGAFRSMWDELGGTLGGTLAEGAVPAGARLLYRQASASLSEAVRDINKYSNNVMASMVFLGLSARPGGPPGSRERSESLVKEWLSAKGLAAPELVMDNGSGLSRQARASAQTLGRALALAGRSAVMPEFIASLPLVAVDGTMRRRLRTESIAGNAHIKTGSLNGARAIGGYVLDRGGQRQAVVFMVNHPNAAATQEAQDAFLRWVYEGAGETASQTAIEGGSKGARAAGCVRAKAARGKKAAAC
ncbi:MAG: D-alanyl-D-alanine carboxypeptidase/D-alanyl-D-alanine-endopeptidase [Burkholderiales bacterium]|nr:D-alanyl-D-alanine carboxypeptidase/D-alanyl-D-alanine-endopeptidase [Burkholderiales bacterium]